MPLVGLMEVDHMVRYVLCELCYILAQPKQQGLDLVAGLTQVRFAAGSPDGVDMQSTDIAISLSFSLSLSLFWSQYKERHGGGIREERDGWGRERIWQLDVTGLVEHLPILGVGGMREHPQPTRPSTP